MKVEPRIPTSSEIQKLMDQLKLGYDKALRVWWLMVEGHSLDRATKLVGAH